MRTHYAYVIVGGGISAARAVEGIRDYDSDGAICMFSGETSFPYSRRILLRNLWRGRVQKDSIATDLSGMGVTHHLGARVTQLRLQEKAVCADDGSITTFDKLLLATGAQPRRFQGSGILTALCRITSV